MEKSEDEKKRTKPSKEELSVFPVAVPVGVLSTVLIAFGTYMFMTPRVPHLDSALDRLLYTFRWLTLSAFTILVFVVYVGSIRRNTSAINPMTGHEYFVEVPNRILRNTLEQFMMHAIGLICLTSFITPERMAAIPAFVTLFVIGRCLYAWGYTRHPMWRAPGFFMTFLPTTGNYLYCLYCLVTYGFAHGL